MFTITVLRGRAEHCRLGLEEGDTFYCQYECPAGFCPKTMALLHTYCEIARCGEDYRLRGASSSHEIDFPCADSCITFRLTAPPAGGLTRRGPECPQSSPARWHAPHGRRASL